MTQPETQPRQGGDGLSAKVGPLPAWGWIVLAAVGGIGLIVLLRSRNATQSTTAPSSVSPDTATTANLQDQLAVVASQIRDLQGGNSTPPPNNPPSGTTQPTQTAVITEGQGLNAFLQRYHITLDQLLALNPDVGQYLRTTNRSGYGPGGPDSLVFNVGATPVIVKIPLVMQPLNTPTNNNQNTVNGHPVSRNGHHGLV